MTQTSPLIDPHTALGLSSVALYLWPVILTIVIAAIRWRSLNHRLGFLILGYLVCMGTGALVGHFGFVVYWLHFAPTVAADNTVAALVNAAISVAVFGTVLSIWPVLWLSKLLGPRIASRLEHC
ncbi:MAG: hypothetical protein OEV90_10185 [Gammaproteobacteria bacterium]|nr:hypothetical protein [Gammaproteobacteria bacterium]